jgi:phage tail sheath gpL-like
MSIPFKQIPSTLKVPLFWAEVDPSRANSSSPVVRALLIGQKTASGDATANTPIVSAGLADAKSRFGVGSQLARMVAAYRNVDPFGELWCLPLADDGAAVAATGTIVFTGPATAAGTYYLYIGGRLVATPVTSGMTANQVAAAVNTAVNAASDLAVTSGVSAATVTLTARNGGACGNDIDIRHNYLGATAGEVLPAGVGATITAMASGATNPTLTAGLAALGDMAFEVVVSPYTDSTSLAALKSFMDDVSGRWSWQQQLYGHVLYAYRATYANLTTFGLTQNDPHASALGVYDSPTPMPEVAALLGAGTMISIRADPATPIREFVLTGMRAPPVGSRLTIAQRNGLLSSGISTFKVSQDGSCVMERLITTYQKNSFSQPDDSYYAAETLFTLAAVLRDLAGDFTSKFARMKLAADGTRFAPGSNVATPATIRASQIAKYRELEFRGWVQQSDVFAEGLVVERDPSNPRRINILWPGVIVGQLDIVALLAQFRLQ